MADAPTRIRNLCTRVRDLERALADAEQRYRNALAGELDERVQRCSVVIGFTIVVAMLVAATCALGVAHSYDMAPGVVTYTVAALTAAAFAVYAWVTR